jgi:flagellin
MSVVINTNASATAAYGNLASANSSLQKSLNRLSSGYKIVQPSDDAGGLAVSMKLSAALKRTDAAANNVANAQSFLSVQDGALKTIGKILDRMSELKTLNDDVTKSSSDKANYDTEFQKLQDQLTSIAGEKFNGVSIYGNSSSTGGQELSVKTTELGGGSVSVSRNDISTTLTNITGAATLGAATLDNITTAIQSVATARALNGAQFSQLQFASEMLQTNRQNLEAANSRIMDVDVAKESTQLARFSILVQSGTAMLAQANASSQIALRLLG